MSTKSPGGGVGPQRCRLILQHCLAIQLSKPGHTPEDFWMYDSGYMIFQNFLSANSKCWWNAPLTAATRALKYAGHVSPGMLLVTAEPCALEVLRGAYARSVLKPPATYVISSVGDIDDCIVQPTPQTQFTPLTEALCDVIFELTTQGQSATIEKIKYNLGLRFSHMQQPSSEVIYDTLVQLMQEGKIYQTSKGYFIVTPERRRSRSRPRGQRSTDSAYDDLTSTTHMLDHYESRTMLMTNSEALHSLYGEISTERDGDLTHQCIQTNLADVICGGNPNDKIMYPRTSKRRSASFPTPRSLERRHSLRIFGSSKRLQRCSSTRSLTKTYAQTLGTDSSSSEYQSTDSSSPKKSASLLSRLFRRSCRNKPKQLETFAAQFPPAEWFNSRAIHLHSIGTQTVDQEMPVAHTLSNSTFYDGSEISQRSMTLPRRHHRRHLSSESTFLISSRDCSPIRRRSPAPSYNSSLPRSTHSIPASTTSTGCGSNNRSPRRTPPNKQILDEQNRHLLLANRQQQQQYHQQTEINSQSFSRNGSGSSGGGKYQNRSGNTYSGPSSLESGKVSLLTSGPSSIDSGKMSYSRTSGHSSLDSQSSANTVAVPMNSSPSRSMKATLPNGRRSSSPKATSTPKPIKSEHKSIPPSSTRNANVTASANHHNKSLSQSQSNSSITLQVTNNHNSIPSTKIFVQNSPVRSVITLENGKLTENSNVFIINNETTTNAKGELINRKVTKQHMPAASQVPTCVSYSENDEIEVEEVEEVEEAASETGDSLSMISENSPDSSLLMPLANILAANETHFPMTSNNSNNNNNELFFENSKFTKNINNDATMNNSRKLSLQIPAAATCSQTGTGIVYKNVLNNGQQQSNPASPINVNTTSYEQIAGSVGNLGIFEKNAFDVTFQKHEPITHQLKKLNSTCDLKNSMQFDMNLTKGGKTLNSNPNINSADSCASNNKLYKNIISVGSEPNLAAKPGEKKENASHTQQYQQQLMPVNNGPNDRRLSLTTGSALNKDSLSNTQQQQVDDLFNFPSLTDLSFNFTSIAAQKILQGVSSSINSIDTLVEYDKNMIKYDKNIIGDDIVQEKQKQQNCNLMKTTNGTGSSATTTCTDFGMV